MPMAAMASVEIDDFFYELNGTEATLVSHSSYTSFLSGSITIPSNVLYNATNYRVTSIGDDAFKNLSGLTSVTIPNSVTSIGVSAFSGCDGLTSITIPNSVTSIGAGAFGGCSSLTSITLPSNLTNIETRVFDGCNGLTSIIIPNSVTTIGGYAFWECRNLTSINIPNSVTRIEENAFGAFCGLTSITIPSSVNYIGDYAFAGCGNLSSMYVNISNPLNFGDFVPGPIRRNMILYVPYGCKAAYETADYWQDFKSIEETIVFDDAKVKEICIANWDTDHDGNLSKEEAAAVTDLSNSFRASSNITSFNELQYFTGLTTIPDEAFYYCSNLSSVNIPSNVTSIGLMAFDGCSNLRTIEGGEGVTYAYSGFSSTPWFSNHSSGILYLGKVAIKGANLSGAVSIKDGTVHIYEGAFRYQTGITSIHIPNSVTSIAQFAFWHCTNMTTVYVDIERPLDMDIDAEDPDAFFYHPWNATLYVPYGCKAAYKAAYYWSDFKEILEMAPTEVDVNIGSAGIATYCSEFDLDFTETDVKAYIVSAFTPKTGKVILTRIYDVPAETGIVVMGDAGEHQIPVVEAQTVVSNMLVGVTEATELNKVDGDYTNYVFAQKNGELGFYAVTDGSTLGAHKAYLPLPTAKLPSSAGARKISMVFDDMTTGVQQIQSDGKSNGDYYDLQGRHVLTPTRGLYIVNGKKVIIK